MNKSTAQLVKHSSRPQTLKPGGGREHADCRAVECAWEVLPPESDSPYSRATQEMLFSKTFGTPSGIGRSILDLHPLGPIGIVVAIENANRLRRARCDRGQVRHSQKS
jgi:hypothetical protein